MSDLPENMYVAIWEDHHSDTCAYLFRTPAAALVWAREQAREADRFGDLEEHELTAEMIKDGWLYYATYSCEGDGLRGVRAKVRG